MFLHLLVFVVFVLMAASGSADDYESTLEEAQEMLFELLVDLKLRSKLTATDSCILAYWAVSAGAGGVLASEAGQEARGPIHRSLFCNF